MAKSHRNGGSVETGSTSSSSRAASARRPDPFALLSNDEVQETQKRASEGASGAGSELPFLDRIQESFGGYDLSGVSAHQDRDAASDISAKAYTFGSDVVFGQAPDLHVAAEEAAHVVAQSAGKGPTSGVGVATDGFEKDARAVADKVVRGESATGDLDRITGGRRKVGPVHDKAVQRREENQPLPQKEVSEEAMKRIVMAREAIAYAKEQLDLGAGNQREALEDTNFNSYFRMEAARDNSAFNITPEVAELYQKNPQAFTAAKAELTKGGNCGEHAHVVYDYLRKMYPDEFVQLAQTKDFDHAYVVIGDPSKTKDDEMIVADAWPTNPTATLWEDHFAYTDDRSRLLAHATSQGDGRDYKQEMLDAGLSLNAKGLGMVHQSLTPEQTQEEIKKGTSGGDHPWIWEHPDTAAETRKFDYVTKKAKNGS